MVHLIKTQSSSAKSRMGPASLNPDLPAVAGLGSFEKLNGFFNAIYDGPTEDPPWHSALNLLCETLHAKHVTLILKPPSPVSTGILVNTDAVAHDATEAYQNHFFTLDPFVGLPEGQVVTPEELVGDKVWKQSTLYREYLKPLDVKFLIGADIQTADGIECRFRVSRGGDIPFSADDIALCRLLLPHMRRALQLHSRLDGLETERQLFAGAVNSMQLGTISLAHNGAVIDLNPEARRILAEKDGIQISNNVLCTDNRREGHELQRLIKEALSGSAGKKGPGLVEALALTRPSGRSSLGILVKEIPPSPWTVNRQRAAAVIFIRDPEASVAETSQKIVQQLFGLTRIEAAMALSLANGSTIEETAENLGLKKNTARTYLRFIFNKTGVTRQTMLVRKLLGSVASLG
ncbi:helix-turn-helix transcriptional regulator [Stenotrophobium rhamnosiphilum]|uniref:Helix-turn-helix transcriptional regulator n=1 Tax=Stenotrophobium rhamnosiphilum TaxID=2029166 RepID=A0A2T5MCG1_9GAMM|nr:helix-turn-helix transcriptional regulator [Stenotrophobium rhamnosiphilum]PTU30251.1 helix-turn-helix transcriptional regulator [Stenotrophobium rhamnosiphilum]